MRTSIKRCALAIIMCGVSTLGIAQEKLLDEDFSTFNFTGVSWGSSGATVNDWKMYQCTLIDTHMNIDVHYLKIEKNPSTSTKKGWATTPTLGYTGDVILSFKYGKTTSKNSKLTLSTNDETVFSDTNKPSKDIDVNQHIDNGLLTATFVLQSIKESTTIKFALSSDNYLAIDDVVVVKDILCEGADNQYFITAHKNKETNVATSRTLVGGIWNTLCLPFNVTKATMEAALGTSQDIQMRTYSSYADGVMNFTPVADTDIIEAGTPFLLKLNTTVTNPTFNSVTVSDTPAKTINHEGVCFVGTYSQKELNADGTDVFITTSGSLAIPTTNGKTMKGMRAHVTVPEDMKFTSDEVRLAIDHETTAIQPTAGVQQSGTTYYNLNGQRLQQPRKGLHIIRPAEGRSQKRNGKITFIRQQK